MKMTRCKECDVDHDPFEGGCPEWALTRREEYLTVAGEMYFPNESGYRPPEEVLEDLDPDIVESARKYALRHGKPWPPQPVNDLGMVTFHNA